jgi:hypothetical protein
LHQLSVTFIKWYSTDVFPFLKHLQKLKNITEAATGVHLSLQIHFRLTNQHSYQLQPLSMIEMLLQLLKRLFFTGLIHCDITFDEDISEFDTIKKTFNSTQYFGVQGVDPAIIEQYRHKVEKWCQSNNTGRQCRIITRITSKSIIVSNTI